MKTLSIAAKIIVAIVSIITVGIVVTNLSASLTIAALMMASAILGGVCFARAVRPNAGPLWSNGELQLLAAGFLVAVDVAILRFV